MPRPNRSREKLLAAAAALAAAGLPAARAEVVKATAAVDVCREETRACRALNRRVEARVLE